MITIVLVWVGMIFLAKAIVKDKVDGFFIGLILGLILGVVLAVVIGVSFPTKTTVIASQPIEEMVFYSGDDGSFYLLSDESKHKFTYRINNVDTIVSSADAEIKFETGVTPYVEYIKVEHDFPKGQEWKWFFGISHYPYDSIVIHVPQGVVYLK